MINAIALFVVALLSWTAGPLERQGLIGVHPTQQLGELEQSSRRAIIETGFSEGYFDEHFSLVSTFDKPGDMRVVWRFSLHGYQTIVSDAIGYYSEHQRKIYVHSIKNTLGSARDIFRTISRRRARALMKSCLGRYAREGIALMRFSPSEKVSLYLTANSAYTRRQRGETTGSRNRSQGGDSIKNEGNERRPPIRLGYINLETGRCSTGLARATP